MDAVKHKVALHKELLREVDTHCGKIAKEISKSEMGSNANTFAFKCILNTFEKYLHLHLNFSNVKYLHFKYFSNTSEIVLKYFFNLSS